MLHEKIQAIVVDHSAPNHLSMRSVPAPMAHAHEALVRVETISLNRGEVYHAKDQVEGLQVGWDLSGIVLTAAADGSGPAVGSQVFGWLPTGSWAEIVAVPTIHLATFPESISFAQAATLPVAGVSALTALAMIEPVASKKILVTGSTGGVGHYLHQILRHSGATVFGSARSAKRAQNVMASGAHQVILAGDQAALQAAAPFDALLDSVGGESLGFLSAFLREGGQIVNFGSTESNMVPFDLHIVRAREISIQFFNLLRAYDYQTSTPLLIQLIQLVTQGVLVPDIQVEAHWSEINQIAERFLRREFTGKAVLHLR